MIEKIDFETYLHISKSNFKIFVFNKKEKKNLYTNEYKTFNNLYFKDSKYLLKFLDENIYKIEKLIGNFIKNIVLVVETEENFNLDIGFKKKNYDQVIDKKKLENFLIETKDLFNENYINQTILHIIIKSFLIDGKRKSSYITDFYSDNLSLEVNFISISNELVFSLNRILEKYQIKVNQYLDGNYINNFIKNDEIELSEMIYNIRNGFNYNEVMLVQKSQKNRGFFEKFFHFFN